MTEPCKHFEICGISECFKHPSGVFCLLHLPAQVKNIEKFTESIRQHLDSGRSDFRYVHFLRDYETDFQEKVFPGLADFRDVVMPQGLNLRGAQLPMGLTVSGRIKSITLDKAAVGGPLEINVGDLAKGLHATEAYLKHGITVSSDRIDRINLSHAVIDGPVNIKVI